MKTYKIAVFMILAVALVLTVMANVYLRSGRVVGVEYDNDLVIIEDNAGQIWLWKGVEDFYCGDYVAMLMWNRFSPSTIYDDVILRLR